MRTALDGRKDRADFRLLQVKPYVIVWKNGMKQTVTKEKLDKFQKEHPNWTTDF